MKLPIILLAIAMLAGCSTTTPVVRNFPDAPSAMMEACPKLETLQDSVKLSDVAKTISGNYAAYYECNVKNDAWIEWYQQQKRIFDSVK